MEGEMEGGKGERSEGGQASKAAGMGTYIPVSKVDVGGYGRG